MKISAWSYLLLIIVTDLILGVWPNFKFFNESTFPIVKEINMSLRWCWLATNLIGIELVNIIKVNFLDFDESSLS